jgi:putative ABC transport system permease protein
MGDNISLSLGETVAQFHIVDVYYDYSSERGEILMDRQTLLRYLPDPAPSNLAVYVAPDTSVETVRSEIVHAVAGHRLLLFSDGEIRAQAIHIFDRTFAITYALEAVAVLVAVMGIAGALFALVIDRRRELGLTRFLGATTQQVRKLILTEAALLGLLANLAGAVLGYFLSLVLIFVINQQSFGFSYGFRPGRSQHQALDALHTGLLTRKVNWVLDLDIKGFFDGSHEWLVKFIEHRIADRRVVRLIQKWLRAGVLAQALLARREFI